ncbi:MAG: membrane protein insertase YidC [Spirochaetales bacterium]|nr:membrane protein insertase YidC [Spirochaetales bacterium]
MEKNTVFAILLSVVVITVGFFIQAKFFPPEDQPQQTVVQQETAPVREEISPAAVSVGSGSDGLPSGIRATDESIPVMDIQVENNHFIATLSTQRGILTSLKLKEHQEEGQPLEMILKGSEDQGAFELFFGGPESGKIDANFHYRRVDDYVHEFYRDFLVTDNGEEVPFTLTKRYTFKPDDYLVELQIIIENSVKEYPALDFNGIAYTVSFGPQIGPGFKKLDGRYDFRNFYTFNDGKLNRNKSKDQVISVTDRVSWVALAGKYFTVIGIPDATPYGITFSTLPVEGLSDAHRIYFSRPLIKSSMNTDTFRFFIGPKTGKALGMYNKTEDNGFGLQNLSLDEVIETSRMWGWLEWILKYLLLLFYKLIPNYGVAIILLTILIKVLTYPITKKSHRSTAKMQELQPKINELKAKYKDTPEKMNKAMTDLYKKEGVNPMGGCLPLLLQFPIFIALYGLLNKHFDLRGAGFIPGWITDLSSPESIWNFAPFQIPLLGWSDLRLLPILFVATQLISSKVMQSGQPQTGQSGMQMKMMTYMMPIMFFFILYNAPSGLLLYWTVSNGLMVLQQLYTNRHRFKKA